MNYLMMPLHEHFDSGFGATGNAFKDAADRLMDAPPEGKNELKNEHLPTNFLYRHAVELFLKSAIVVFHRRFKTPYGDVPFDGEPHVLVNGQWMPFIRVHGLRELWSYVVQLFQNHAEWLKNNTKCDWTFPGSVDELITRVNAEDPRSTFFRYPTLKNVAADTSKSKMIKAEGSIVEAFVKRGEHGKVFGLIAEKPDGNVNGYFYDAAAATEFGKAVRQLAQECYDMHAALRWEVCGGW